jgi:hypothetical protein
MLARSTRPVNPPSYSLLPNWDAMSRPHTERHPRSVVSSGSFGDSTKYRQPSMTSVTAERVTRVLTECAASMCSGGGFALCGRGHGIKPPLARDALELAGASVVEGEPGAGYEIFDRT